MNYNHFTMDERIVIAQLMKSGYSIREISRILDRAPSSISREIKRNTHLSGRHYKIKHYNPVTAQNKYESRKKKCGRKSINSSEILEYIKEKIELHWSPEQISNYPSNIKVPSIATIYRIIHSNKIKNISMTNLRRKENLNVLLKQEGNLMMEEDLLKNDLNPFIKDKRLVTGKEILLNQGE